MKPQKWGMGNAQCYYIFLQAVHPQRQELKSMQLWTAMWAISGEGVRSVGGGGKLLESWQRGPIDTSVQQKDVESPRTQEGPFEMWVLFCRT